MVSISPFSLTLQIINFLLLIYLLNSLLYKPIREILRARKEKIDDLEKSVAGSTKEAEDKDLELISGLKDARLEGKKQKDAIIQEAADQEKDILSKINEKAQSELAEIKSKIEKDTEQVSKSLQKEIDIFAESIGNKILGRAV